MRRYCRALAILVMALCASPALAQTKPIMTLMTALPLQWGEGGPAALLQGRSGKSPLLAAIEAKYQVRIMDVIDAASLAKAPIFVLAQPRALQPEEFAVLDDWVRRGGRLLVFTDPLLAWPSELLMGDRARAPVIGLLDPLLSHWGLVLDSPVRSEAMAETLRVDGYDVSVSAPGTWRLVPSGCRITEDRLIARCRIGQGQAILVADADMLDARRAMAKGADNENAVLSLIDDVAGISRSTPSHAAWIKWAMMLLLMIASVVATRAWQRHRKMQT
jgi:ABC-type uncharacterized transport system